MSKNNYTFIFFITLVLGSYNCQKEPSPSELLRPTLLPEVPFDYFGFDLPEHFSGTTFIANIEEAQKDNKTTLGRVLFYDKHLSQNNTISCASCHQQAFAFSDPLQFSIGFKGDKTKRNSMSIFNSGYGANFFWDGRAPTLKDQVTQPILDPLEMGMTDMAALVSQLKTLDYYPSLFEKAYGDSEITADRIATALVYFNAAVVSKDSKYDKGEASSFENFTAQEKLGHDVFINKANCATCHRKPLFSNSWKYRNIGLDSITIDQGNENGAFRVPTLRNIALTAPYMHDGRFQTLEEVVEHYNSGIQPHPFLTWKLLDETGAPLRMNLTTEEKTALVTFLKTLTDEDMITAERFSNPFQ